jgi:hypothetical protein
MYKTDRLKNEKKILSIVTVGKFVEKLRKGNQR